MRDEYYGNAKIGRYIALKIINLEVLEQMAANIWSYGYISYYTLAITQYFEGRASYVM